MISPRSCASRDELSSICREPLDFDFFGGNAVHVLADVGHQIFDQAAGPLKLEIDRHAVLDRILDPADGSADVAQGIAAQKKHAEHGERGAGQ